MLAIWNPSVVVAVIHQHRVGAVESKRHSPIAAHPNRPVTGQLTFEWVQPPAGQAHVLRAAGHIELRQLPSQPGSMSRLNPRLAAGPEEGFKPLVNKSSNHFLSV